MTFRSNHRILLCTFSPVSEKKHFIEVFNPHFTSLQSKVTSPTPSYEISLASGVSDGVDDLTKRHFRRLTEKTRQPKGFSGLPVSDKTLIVRTDMPDRSHILHPNNTFAPASPTPSRPSAHAGGRKRLMITPFDLTMWRTSAIRLYYGQGYPGTCLLVWNDVACHWFKWQLDGSVSSTGTHRRHD